MFRSKTCSPQDTRLSKIGNAPNDPEWPQVVNCQKYPAYTEYSHPRPKFHSVWLYDEPCLRYKVDENRKCTQWPQNDLNHLSVKSTLSTLNTHPRAKISLFFTLWPAIFEIQGCRKSEMNPMTQNDLNHLSVTSTLSTLNTHLWCQTFTPFRSTTTVFEIQDNCRKS